MATPAQRTNTWTLDEWYAQAVAGTTGGYVSPMNGELWTWGLNENGVIGQNLDSGGPGILNSRSSPIQLPGTTWSDILGEGGGAEQETQGALKSDGTLWMWGRNQQGQLGLNEGGPSTDNARSSPTQVPGTWKLVQDDEDGTNINQKNIACSGGTYAIKNDGTLWAWGSNAFGQLGLNQSPGNSGATCSSPTQVGTGTWKALNFGRDGVFQGIKTDGTLWMMGRGQYGRSGWNDLINRSSPTQVGTNTNWKGVGGSGQHCFATKTDGTLWGYGNNNSGQLGVNNTSTVAYSSPVQIGTNTTWSTLDTTEDASIAIKTDGTLWGWGRNEAGSLGLSQVNDTYYSSPTQIGTGTTWQNVSAVGGNSFISNKTDGTLWAWGYNNEGQLGVNNKTNYSSPRQIPGTDWSIKIGGYNQGASAIKTP